MIYLKLYWILVFCFLLLYLLSSFIKNLKTVYTLLDDNAIYFVIVGASLLIVAIASNDPVTIAGITLPMEVQWFASLLVLGFGTWKVYFSPLKERVIHTEKEIAAINVHITPIPALERRIMQLETDVASIKTDTRFLKEDMALIKQKILSW